MVIKPGRSGFRLSLALKETFEARSISMGRFCPRDIVTEILARPYWFVIFALFRVLILDGFCPRVILLPAFFCLNALLTFTVFLFRIVGIGSAIVVSTTYM